MRAPPGFSMFSVSSRQLSTCSTSSTSMPVPTTPSLPMKVSAQTDLSTMGMVLLTSGASILLPRQQHPLVLKYRSKLKVKKYFSGKNKKPQNIMEILFMTCSWMTGVFFFSILVGKPKSKDRLQKPCETPPKMVG